MITRVRLENWKSHYDSELTFSNGVNVLVGEMGAGKSSVMDAITFGLFGTTPALQSRKVTLDEVLRRTPSEADEGIVEVDFVHENETYTVKRVIKRGSGTDTAELRKGDELLEAPQATTVTSEVEDIIGIDYDVFARVVYAEQNNVDAFLTLRAGERKEKVDELLELDRFEQARKTLVSVINRLEDRRTDKREALDQLRDDLDVDEITAFAEQVAQTREDLETFHEKKKSVEKELAEQQSVFNETKEKQEQYEELKQKRTALKTRIEALQERIDRMTEELGELATLDQAAVAKKRTALEEEREQLKVWKTEIQELRTKRDSLTEQLDEKQERKEMLEKRVKQLDQLDEVKNALTEKQEERETLNAKQQKLTAQKEAAQEALQHLSRAADTCPTCGQELTEEHRIEMLQENKETITEIEEQIGSIRETVEALTDDIDALQARQERLLQLKGTAEEISELEERIAKLEEDRSQIGERLADRQEQFDADRLESVQDTLHRLSDVAAVHELQEEHRERTEQLAELEEKQDELGFEEDRFEELRARVNELEKQRDVLDTKIENQEEILQEREDRLDELREQQDRLTALQQDITAYEEKVDAMNNVLAGLERAQVELRERFVAAVNEVMEQVWAKLYPYEDYATLRVNAAEDYRVEVQDEEGSWYPVEGQVSGGERHTAALTLRVALSIVLAPSWRILILDEPTHNLDVQAIEDLADTLREEVSDIVEQLFLITHEERLETAVTGELYKLSKKDEDSGVTRVEQAEAGF